MMMILRWSALFFVISVGYARRGRDQVDEAGAGAPWVPSWDEATELPGEPTPYERVREEIDGRSLESHDRRLYGAGYRACQPYLFLRAPVSKRETGGAALPPTRILDPTWLRPERCGGESCLNSIAYDC